MRLWSVLLFSPQKFLICPLVGLIIFRITIFEPPDADRKSSSWKGLPPATILVFLSPQLRLRLVGQERYPHTVGQISTRIFIVASMVQLFVILQ